MIPLFPLFAMAGGLFLLTREQEREIGPQPVFPPDAIQKHTVLKQLEGGGTARYFQPETGSALQKALSNFALEAVQPEALPNGLRLPGNVYRIFPIGQGAAIGTETTALQAITMAQASGLVVMATLSTMLLGAPTDKFLMFTTDRKLAAQGSHWAILADAAGVPAIAEATPVVVGGFDADLPMDVRIDIARLLSRPDAAADELEAAAKVLEGTGETAQFPLAVAALRTRAHAILLRDQIRRVATIPQPVEVKAEVVGNPDPPFTADQAVESSDGTHPPVVLGSVMGEKRSKKTAPPNGAAQA